jgi:hypothetical protein
MDRSEACLTQARDCATRRRGARDMDTVLATAEWQTFTAQHWQLEPVRLEFQPRGDNGPSLRAVLYADRRGRMQVPAYQPHLPLRFVPTPTAASYRIERQWLETAQLLVEEMMARGTRGEVTLPPSMTDPRPWRWAHFRVTPRFTNLIDYPFTWAQADRVVRQQAAKAERAGFTCRRTEAFDDLLACLGGTQARRGFAYGMTLPGLELAHRLLGPEALRVYVCYAPSGDPATARVVLHRAGGRALDWMAGTRDAWLRSGATQLLLAHALEDTRLAGATGYNSCGADVESVAQTKLLWGGTLAPQYAIQAYDWLSMRRFLGGWLRFERGRRALRQARRAPASEPTGAAPREGQAEGERQGGSAIHGDGSRTPAVDGRAGMG